jgi:hypothetical protein
VVWFALDDDRPLTAFAGIWTDFKGDRGTKSKPVPGPHLVYEFLTISPNAIVEPIHPKAMPVILTTDEELDARAVGRGQGAATAPSPTMPCGLSPAAPIRKIMQRRDCHGS